jgi:hypothetical protein
MHSKKKRNSSSVSEYINNILIVCIDSLASCFTSFDYYSMKQFPWRKSILIWKQILRTNFIVAWPCKSFKLIDFVCQQLIIKVKKIFFQLTTNRIRTEEKYLAKSKRWCRMWITKKFNFVLKCHFIEMKDDRIQCQFPSRKVLNSNQWIILKKCLLFVIIIHYIYSISFLIENTNWSQME